MIEVILMSAVITNSLFLYIASDLVKDFLNDILGVPERNHLWIVVIVEHILIASLLIVKVFIPDVPKKFKKLLIRVGGIMHDNL